MEPSMHALALCAQTVPQCSFFERVVLAAEHGFRYTSILGPEYRQLLAGGQRPASMRDHLDRHGIAIAEVDALVGWLPGAALPPELATLPGLPELLDIAGELGARSLNVVDLVAGEAPPLDHAVEAFASVCDRAAPQDLLVGIEFIPWTRVPDLATAVAIAERAGRPNGGVTFDSWHHHRCGATVADLDDGSIARIVALQINDAPASEFAARTRQTDQRRLLPGHGDIGIGALLHRLEAGGCDAPIGLEVTSVDLAAQPPVEVVAAAARSVRGVFPGAAPAG